MDHPLQVRIGQRIRRRREELGMTQQELAGRELTRGFISQLEKGIVMPSLQSLQLIAARLHKPVSYFLEEEADPPASDRAPLPGTLLAEALAQALWGQPEAAHAQLLRLRDQLSGPPDGPPDRPARDPAGAGTGAAAPGYLFLVEGLLAFRHGQHARAAELLQAAAGSLSAAGEDSSGAVATALGAEALLEAGEPGRAAEHLESWLEGLTRHGPPDPFLPLWSRSLLGLAYARSGQPARAVPVLEEVVRAAGRAGWWVRPAEVFLALGRAYLAVGQRAEAVEVLQRSAGLAGALGQQAVRGSALVARAEACSEPEQAAALLREAREAFRSADDPVAAAATGAQLARLLAGGGRRAEALEAASSALAELPEGSQQAGLLVLTGRLLAELGREAEGRRHLEQAVRLAEGGGLTRELAEACSELGNLLRRTGQHQLAAEYLSRAVSLYAAAQTG